MSDLNGGESVKAALVTRGEVKAGRVERYRLIVCFWEQGLPISAVPLVIERFSGDIDITVFRDDLDERASVEELESLSKKKRRARLDAISDACRAYITGPLREFLSAQLADSTGRVGRVETDDADPDGRTLLVWYPEVEPRDGAYVQPAVRIEAGVKSALAPHRSVTIQPYIAEDTRRCATAPVRRSPPAPPSSSMGGTATGCLVVRCSKAPRRSRAGDSVWMVGIAGRNSAGRPGGRDGAGGFEDDDLAGRRAQMG